MTKDTPSLRFRIKIFSNLKKIVNIRLKAGWLSRDPFIGYKINKRDVIREILLQEEIDLLASKTFPTDRLAVIRDIFLFSCYSGLAYADVKKLKRSEIIPIQICEASWISENGSTYLLDKSNRNGEGISWRI